jgi:phage portal protein BeeE
MSLADAEYIASMNMSNEDICRIFGVPPFKVFHFNKMTYDNMEQMSTEFVQSSVMPDAIQLEQELNYKLFSPWQAKQRYEIKFDLRSLMRADSTAQANWITKMVGVGGLTVNEVREMDDRNPVPGGDEAFIQANNYFPLSMMKELAAATIKGKNNKGKTTGDNQMKLFDDAGEPVSDDKGADVTQTSSTK